jgi:hypothetical protein
MDEWHRRVVRDLVAETPAGFAPDATAALEVAFGKARSAIAYVLELARAHRIAAGGNVFGDDVWLQLGGGRVRFTLNRREGHIVVARPGHDETRIVAGAAETAEVSALVREAIDALVAEWRALPAHAKRPNAPPAEFEDEPTKR